MKRMFFSLVVALTALTFSIEGNAYVQDPAKKEIKAEELPKAVRNAVGTSEYAAWALVKVYEVPSETTEGAVDYQVKVKDNTGKALLLIYDKDGKLLETKEDN